MYVYHNIKIYVINDNDLITKNKIIDFVIRKINVNKRKSPLPEFEKNIMIRTSREND